MVNLQRVKTIHKGESTLKSGFDHVEYNISDANDLIITRESFINTLQGLDEDLKNASGINKDRILEEDCRGKIKTRYDKNPFWGILISQLDEDIFKHSPDYRSVNLRGVEFSLTSKQAQVIEILHELYEKGTLEVGGQYILERLGDDDSDRINTDNRLRDIFKSRPNAWGNLIVPGGSKGSYRLNI